MHLPPPLLSNVHDIYGEAGDAWLKDLPQLIEELSSRWNFRFLKPIENLSYNFVGLVEMKTSSQTAILKMAPKEGVLNREITWLKCMEEGVPQVYQADGSLQAFLMEHLKPGETLKKLVREDKDDEATRIVCRTMRKFHTHQHGKKDFPHLSEQSKSLAILRDKIEERLFLKAQSLFLMLTSNRTNDVLLHGDLHHDNILSSGGDWKAIDPHGYIGDPAAEVGPMMSNAIEYLPKKPELSNVIERRLRIMEEELPFDFQRIASWAFCMSMISLAWSVEDHGIVPESDLEVARVIEKIL